jgi:hypothetical protein
MLGLSWRSKAHSRSGNRSARRFEATSGSEPEPGKSSRCVWRRSTRITRAPNPAMVRAHAAPISPVTPPPVTITTPVSRARALEAIVYLVCYHAGVTTNCVAAATAGADGRLRPQTSPPLRLRGVPGTEPGGRRIGQSLGGAKTEPQARLLVSVGPLAVVNAPS